MRNGGKINAIEAYHNIRYDKRAPCEVGGDPVRSDYFRLSLYACMLGRVSRVSRLEVNAYASQRGQEVGG